MGNEHWYKIVYPPFVGVIVSDRGRVLQDDPDRPEATFVFNGDEYDTAEAVCRAFNGPPQPNSLKTVAFKNGDRSDTRPTNVFWATKSGRPQVYDTEIRHVNGDLLDNRRDNLFLNEDPSEPPACWAIPFSGE